MRIEPTAGQTVVSAAHHHIGRAHASLSLLLLLLLFICCCFYSHIIPACCYFIGGAFVVLVVMFLFVLCGFVFLVFSSSRQSMASRRRWRPCSQLLECSQEKKHIRIIIFNTSIAIKTIHQDRIRPEEAKADTGVYSVRKHGNILDLFRTENTFYLNKQQSRLLRTSNIYSPLKRAARFKPGTSN